ncbi:LysR family transcriptional regulator [Nocardia terpenica]|uniref:LysR family transcriptional regulator n=1 Tax=Nocardia terpenica TaxID=455432 RepID=A0A164KEB0_9NOCA|nr:LysR family transcriptional regulator [Nocardia terpenica]KZM71311.1 LysR family transcriptional regulator [Nocardia terpenica]NQE90452.1 LysR family transcriptional regulator [Nocardia terpenica]
MDFTQRMLEQFVVLAEEKHFGRAAERLSMSQPPLSQAIQRLERGLAVALLDRTVRGVRLTPAGEAFARDAQQMLDLHAAATERARRIAAGLEGELRVGFINSLSYRYLPRLLGWIAEEMPGLWLHLRQESSIALADLVRNRILDLAFIRASPHDPDGLEIHHVVTERLIAALPHRHRLADRDGIRLRELAGDTFVDANPEALPGLSEQLRLACREAGFLPRTRGDADDLLGLISYVASGSCVCLVPEQLAQQTLPTVRFVPLRDSTRYLETRIAAIHRTDAADAAVRRIIDLIDRRSPRDTATDGR